MTDVMLADADAVGVDFVGDIRPHLTSVIKCPRAE